MKWLILVAMATGFGHAQSAAPQYFHQQRAVEVRDASRQNFVALDLSVWEHAQADLADVRLYGASGAEAPYALVINGEQSASEEKPVRLFNLAKAPHGTEFLLEIGESEYNRVQLQLTAHDYTGRALVEAT